MTISFSFKDSGGGASNTTVYVTASGNETLSATVTANNTVDFSLPTITLKTNWTNYADMTYPVKYKLGQLMLYKDGASYGPLNWDAWTSNVNKNVAATVPARKLSQLLGAASASDLFSSSNNTSKTCKLTVVWNDWTFVEVPDYPYQFWTPTSIKKTLSTITVTLNAPPAFYSTPTLSKNTTDYYTTLTQLTATVPVRSSSAKYGGYISKIVLTVGSQSVTKTYTSSTKPTTDQTLNLTLANAGTFTPTVVMTDSRGQTVTQTFSSITVNQYNAPSLSFDVFRTNANGVRADEGCYAIAKARLTYSAPANLTQPTLSVKDQDNNAVTTSVTWYSAYNNSSGVDPNDEISDWTSISSGSYVYGLISVTGDEFDVNQSYSVTIQETDTQSKPSAEITQTLSTAFYTIDFRAGGKEIAFGAPANDDLTNYPNGLFKCGMEAQFNKEVEFNEETTFNDTVNTTANIWTRGRLKTIVDWNGSSTPSENKSETIDFLANNADKNWLGSFGTTVYSAASGSRQAGAVSSYTGVRNIMSPNDTANYITAFVNPDGTRGYSVSDQSAFRSAIGLSGMGTIYSANKNVNTTGNADSYVTGASITLPAGKYVVMAYGSFPSASTNGVVRVQLYNSTAGSTVATKGAYGSGWLSDQIIWMVGPSASTTYTTRISSSVARTNAVTYCVAIRII